MNTIKDLAKNWWATLNWSLKDSLSNFYYNGAIQSTLLDEEIENIFYQEVIIKWFQDSYYSKITNSEEGYKANLLQAQDIIEIYLKEHTKEQPQSVEDNVWDEELINKFFYYLKYDKGVDTLEDSFMNDFKQHYSLIKK
jgi:hypothetical protein